MIKNKKVFTKLLLMVLPLIITVIACVTYFSYRQMSIYKEAEIIFNQHLYTAQSALLNADRDYYQAFVAELELVHNTSLDEEGRASQTDDYHVNIQQTIDRVQTTVDIVMEDQELYKNHSTRDLFVATYGAAETDDPNGYLNGSVTFEQIVNDFSRDFAEWQSLFNPETGVGDFDAKQEQFVVTREYINTMTDFLDLYSAYESTVLLNGIRTTMYVTIAIIICIMSTVIFLSMTIARYLRKNILIIAEDMAKLADNDLTFEPLILNSKDELGTLALAVNHVRESMMGIVALLNGSSEELRQSSKIMNVATDNSNESVQSIRKAVNDIAVAANQQAAETEKIVEEMSTMKEIVGQSHCGTETLNEASQQISQATIEGMRIIEELLVLTLQNQKACNQIFDMIDKISESTDKIGEASSLISEIADQTNLLSLNASIEAARAGESGRGFAVVAEEIRKLAEDSAHTVGIIDKMLQGLQTNADLANKQSVVAKQGVESQQQSVSSTKEKYGEIVLSIKAVETEIKTFYQINNGLESNFNSISRLLENLSAVSEENAATMQELSSTADLIADSMQQIKENSDEVRDSSEDMHDVIAKFKTT